MTLTLPTALVLGLVAFLARRTEGSWVAPAPLFSAFWTGILGVAALAFPTLDALTSAALYILCAMLAVWVGSLIGHGFDPPVGQPASLREIPYLRTLLSLSVLLGLAETVSLFWRRGFVGSRIFSLQAIFQVAVANRAALYAGGQQPVWEWFVFLLLYTSTPLGGMLFRLRRTRWDLALSVASPLLLWVVFLLYGSRVGVLYGGAIWVAAYLATSALVVKDSRIFNSRGLARTAVLGCVLLLGLSIVTQGVRYETNSRTDWRSVLADGFSFPAAMGIWLDERGFVGGDFTAGARTFTRVVDKVGIVAAPLPAIPVAFTSSNIYTVFRDAIEDFGTIGSIVFFLAFGWLGRVLYARARGGRANALTPLIALYAFVFTSPADGIFFYTVSIAAIVLFGGYISLALSGQGAGALVDGAMQPIEGK